MEINELVNEVKNNNNEAYKELLEMYHRMIYSIINEYDMCYGDYQISKDDLYQEACIALYDACLSYKEVKEAKFSTFVYTVIKRRIGRFYRIYKERYVNEIYSIDKIETADHYKAFESKYVYDNPIYYHKLQNMKEQISGPSSKLSEEDRKILLMRMENYSYEEIATKLKINKKKVDNRLMRMKKDYLNKK